MAEVQYARADDGTHIAYQVLDAALHTTDGYDLVMISGGTFPMESYDGNPGFARMMEGLRAIGRVVVFDRRGIGLSDPPSSFDRPILDQWTEDLRAVIDAAGVTDPIVFAWDGFGVGSRFAARYPECLSKLVLHHPIVGDSNDDWFVARWELIRRNVHGESDGEDLLRAVAPSEVNNPTFREWYLRAGRSGASPASAMRMWESVFTSAGDDQLLDEVEAPTLVVYRAQQSTSPIDAVDNAIARLRRVTAIELEGADLFPFLGDVDAMISEIAQFVVGERRTPPPQRTLAAVLFTDLVGSTARAASLGDAQWKALLDRHDTVIGAAVEHCGGTVVKGTGDGVVALLPSASSALQVADRIRKDLAIEGLEARFGIHVGDVDRRGDDISGLAVNIAARVMAKAGTNEIYVTDSVVASTGGPGEQYESQGEYELKGVPGEWSLSRYESTG
jgi:class 3 adenylate cyclase/pimeloyl-ACP methyl ester carboxylesterase